LGRPTRRNNKTRMVADAGVTIVLVANPRLAYPLCFGRRTWAQIRIAMDGLITTLELAHYYTGNNLNPSCQPRTLPRYYQIISHATSNHLKFLALGARTLYLTHFDLRLMVERRSMVTIISIFDFQMIEIFLTYLLNTVKRRNRTSKFSAPNSALSTLSAGQPRCSSH
jgi:hypothetical protein